MSTLLARPVHEFHATGKRFVNQKWQERDHSPHAPNGNRDYWIGMTCCFQMLFEHGIRLVASSQSSDGMKNVPKSGILQVEFWKNMDEHGAYVPQSIGWTESKQAFYITQSMFCITIAPQNIPSTHWRTCRECAILFQKTLCSVAFLHEHPGKHTSVHESKFDKNLDSMIFTRIYIYIFTSLMIWFIYIYILFPVTLNVLYLIWKPKGSSLSSPNGPLKINPWDDRCAGDRCPSPCSGGYNWITLGFRRPPSAAWEEGLGHVRCVGWDSDGFSSRYLI